MNLGAPSAAGTASITPCGSRRSDEVTKAESAASVRSGIEAARHLARFAELLDDQIPRVSLNDPFDLRSLMSAGDDEPGGMGANTFILAHRQANCDAAARVGALAEKAEEMCVVTVGTSDLVDRLIHLTEKVFVLC